MVGRWTEDYYSIWGYSGVSRTIRMYSLINRVDKYNFTYKDLLLARKKEER